MAAACTIGPEGLGSRHTSTRPPSRYDPNASAKRTTSSGVSVSPTTPRTPVMPIFSGCIATRIVPPERAAVKSRRPWLSRSVH